MSFLSVLLVASAFYFAHARPDSQSLSDGSQHAPEVPVETLVPITDLKDYQHQLVSFMEDVSKSVDKYMTPLMAKLDVKKRDELKSMGMNGFASYINYLLLLIEKIENEKDKVEDETHGDEMLIEFGSWDTNMPFMAEYPVEYE